MNDENEVVLEKETMCEEFKWNYSESKKNLQPLIYSVMYE